jgi:hypothetical protein
LIEIKRAFLGPLILRKAMAHPVGANGGGGRMHRLLILTLATAIPAAPIAPAMVPGFIDGARLAVLCGPAASDAEVSRLLCLGYIVGSVDQLLARQARRPFQRQSLCLPKDLPVEQLVETIERRLIRYPKVQSAAASAVIRDALEARYPCRPEPDVGRP